MVIEIDERQAKVLMQLLREEMRVNRARWQGNFGLVEDLSLNAEWAELLRLEGVLVMGRLEGEKRGGCDGLY